MSMSGKQWALMFVGILVVVPLSQFLGRSLAEQHNGRDRAETANARAKVGQNTQVLVSRQDSEGVVNEQVNVESANAIGEYSLERMKHHTKKILAEMNSSDSVEMMTQKTVLVPNDGLNLIVTRFYIGDVNHSLQVAGIKGNELVRVGCISPRGDVEVMLAGKCAGALHEQFNFEMPGGAI